MQRTIWRGLGDGSIAYDPAMMDALLNAQDASGPPTGWAAAEAKLSQFIPKEAIMPLAVGAIGLGLVLALMPSGSRRR